MQKYVKNQYRVFINAFYLKKDFLEVIKIKLLVLVCGTYIFDSKYVVCNFVE